MFQECGRKEDWKIIFKTLNWICFLFSTPTSKWAQKQEKNQKKNMGGYKVETAKKKKSNEKEI
jgi:hypothetical protein